MKKFKKVLESIGTFFKSPIRILKLLGNTLFVVFFVGAILFSITNLAAKNKGGIPNIFGGGYLSVQSGSMKFNETKDYSYLTDQGITKEKIKKTSFDTKALISIKMLNEAQAKNLKVGDVIAFQISSLYMDLTGLTIISQGDTESIARITHRIIEVRESEGGIVSYATQGDNNQFFDTYRADGLHGGEKHYVQSISIDGLVTGHTNGLGGVISWFQQPLGFFLIIVVPTVIFLIVELISFIQSLYAYRAEKNGTTLVLNREELKAQIIAEERERIKQELLAEQNNTPEEETSQKPEDKQ
ncbi:MAG: hypothetical protein LBM99_00595 [Bacillales bacterium]|jgi:hypothetical protein|nr:hypothetical protein [Bacillales bacterium]